MACPPSVCEIQGIAITLHKCFQINQDYDYSTVTLHNCFRVNNVMLKKRRVHMSADWPGQKDVSNDLISRSGSLLYTRRAPQIETPGVEIFD